MYKIKLSPYHKIFYNEWKIDPENFKYNIVFDQTISSNLSIPRLRNALNRFIADYLLFNSHIIEEDNELYWVENDKINELEYFNVSDYSGQYLYDFVTKPFDLENNSLYRFGIFEDKNSDFRLIIVVHHILIDGNSFDDFINQISNYYNSNLYESSPSLTFQKELIYKSIESIEGKLNSANYKQFWENQLSDVEPVDLRFLIKNTYHTRSHLVNKKYNLKKEITFNISKTNMHKLDNIVDKYSITPYIYGQCIFALLLHRYSSQNRLVISFPTAIKESVPLICGSAVNTNFIVYDFTKTTTVVDLFDQAKTFFKMLKHSKYNYYPVYKILENVSREFLNTAFIQTNLKHTIFNFTNTATLKINNQFNIDLINNFVFEQEHKNHCLNYRVKYDTHNIDIIILRNFIRHYKKLFVSVLSDLNTGVTDKPLHQYQILDIKEYNKIVYTWNQTKSDYPRYKTIHQLFEEQVKRTPKNIAIVYEDIQLSYTELNLKANQLAHYICSICQIIPDDRIALCLDRNEYMIISILAVLKSGASYVPIDPTHQPSSRINFILEDTQARLLITNNNYCKNNLIYHKYGEGISVFYDDGRNILTIPIDSQAVQSILFKQITTNLKVSTSSTNLAYVIYTSGTTGLPNGVMIGHRNVINFIYGLTFSKYEHLNAAFTAPYIFDVSVFDIWSNLFNGYSIFIVTLDILTSKNKFNNFINKHKINKLYLSASFLKFHIDTLSTSKNIYQLLTGVEPVFVKDILKLSNIKEIINGYGPTETTVCATFYSIITSNFNHKIFNQKLPIGKPIANITCYILDSNRCVTPLGVIGELYVGGDSVSRGYLKQPKLTEQRFIKNPFVNDLEKLSNTRVLYKTGDLVRRLTNGNIEYMGRNDSQVKVNGYRIELGEIETVLCKFPAINQAVVVTRDYPINSFDNYLINIDKDIKGMVIKNNCAVIKNKSIISTIVKPMVSNKLSMLPIQEWFFLQNFTNINHWNQSFLMKAPKLNRGLLVKCLTQLVNNHHCFHLCFKRNIANKNLTNIPYYVKAVAVNKLLPIKLQELNISKLPYKEGTLKFNEQINKIFTDWQSNFDIENGPLFNFGYIYGYQDGSTRVYFALHHLIVDVVSWHILVYDLQKIYTELSVPHQNSRYDKQINSPNIINKNYTSYQQWVNIVKSYAISHVDEKEYWANLLSGYKEFDIQLDLLVNKAKRLSRSEDIACSSVTFALSKSDSNKLINHKFNKRINSILLTPVVSTLQELFLNNLPKVDINRDTFDTMYITLEGHGRENILTDIDITHTTGWFTTMYPVKLIASNDLMAVLEHITAVLQNIPNNGIGYGALFGYNNLPRIRFNFLGQLNKFAADWSITDEPSGKSIDDKNKNGNVVDILGYIVNERLIFKITSQFQQDLLNQFVTIMKTKIITLINAINKGHENYTILSNKHLVAYYVSEHELNPNKIREYLQKYLPQYSVPSIYIHINAIPLTLNGKVDTKALPQPNTLGVEKYIAPNNEIERLICIEFDKVLNKSPIGIYDDFFTCGGDSMSAINLVRLLQYNFNVNVRDIYNYRTPYKLAQNIQFSNNSLKNRLLSIINVDKNEKQGRNYKIANNSLRKYLDSIKMLCPDISNKKINNVLLTGATGFLGCNILNQLLVYTNYNVYILVRAESKLAAIKRIKHKYKLYFTEALNDISIGSRLFVYCADLEQANFGLSYIQYAQLFNKIDSVIHTAALVKQIGDYDTFYSANVQATINLLDFTNLTNLKDFHYISTMSVLKHNIESESKWGSYYPENLQPNNLELLDNNIYLRTKLEAELQVLKYREYGLNTNIYRVGNLAFISKIQSVQENIKNVGFAHWLKYFLHSKLIFQDCKIDLSPVDIVAESIVKLFDKNCSIDNIYHVFNPCKFDLARYLCFNKNLAIQVVPERDFIRYVINELENNTNIDLLLRFLLIQGWIDVEGMYQFSKRIYLQDKTQYILKRLRFEWKYVRHKQFGGYINNILKLLDL